MRPSDQLDEQLEHTVASIKVLYSLKAVNDLSTFKQLKDFICIYYLYTLFL
jgi:hypothetical protein